MDRSQIEQRFQRRNIERCLFLIFPPEFDDQHRSAIAHEIQHLMSLLKTNFKQEFAEFDFLISEAKRHSLLARSSLNAVQLQIKKNKTLGKHYLPAFISSELQRSSYNQAKFEQYKALTLIVSTRLLMMGEHESAVKGVCNEIRLFSDGRRESLAAWLPDVLIKNLPELINDLDIQRLETAGSDKTKNVSSQLSKLYVPYHDSYKFNAGVTRSISSREFTKHSAINSLSQQQLDDGNETVIELREISSSSQENWAQEEDNSGQTRSLSAVTLDNSASTSASYASRAMQAKSINNRILKKKMSLTCDIYQPSVFEIRILIIECISTLNSVDHSTAQLILFMLMFGNKSEQIKKLQAVKHGHEIIGITRTHILPSQKQRVELTPLLKKIHQKFIIPVPTQCCDKLRNFKFKGVSDEKIKIFIKQINNKHNTNITQTKISAFLNQTMTQECVDPVFTELIRGPELSDLAALSYTQVKVERLIAAYQRYLAYLTNISDHKMFNFIWEVKADELVGSPLAIEHNILRKLFSSLTIRLKISTENIRGIHSAEHHNLVGVHVQLILALSSGYRPVTGWLGKISDINLITGQYWISDKENHLGDASRIIILPQLTLDIVKKYLAFIKHSAVHYRNINPQLSLRYQDAINGEEHLFFYRTNTHYNESTPKTITEQLDTIFPLPPNWHRHHIRTLLHNAETSPELMAAWMGHADIGQGSFTQYSSMSINELKTITDEISHHLTDIGIQVVNYEK